MSSPAPEVVVHQDAEARAVTYLRARLPGMGVTATVATRVPSQRPPLMVRVSRTGGPARDVVTDQPQLTVECWGTDSVQAGNLARFCRALMHAWPRDDQHGRDVGRVSEVGGLAAFPDPLSDQPRYQFTVQVAMRGYAA